LVEGKSRLVKLIKTINRRRAGTPELEAGRNASPDYGRGEVKLEQEGIAGAG